MRLVEVVALHFYNINAHPEPGYLRAVPYNDDILPGVDYNLLP